ncbi:glutamate receptor ionotropic, kainate 2-like [Pectinophora gossypiella]|uniref:glutamate receptor ionotropic, kainate 2-like n=1 Tax=Pectinophora gossypiella TaxID=13191 RepID=UPI00214E1B14|nr:glutamate receptor ionotropic, kainate 2-like [Pectinophora gossypiella]
MNYIKMWCTLFFLLSVCLHNTISQIQYLDTTEEVYNIAGIFETNAKVQTLAFNESTPHANLDNRRLNPSLIYPPRTDSYSIWRELCKHVDIRPIALFGPQSAIGDGAVRLQCAIAQIPHLQATWQPFDPDVEREEEEEEPEAEEQQPTEEETNDEESENADSKVEEELPIYKNITINFYPDSNEISLAYAKLLKYYGWTNFAALYEDDFGLLRIQKILAEHTDQYPLFIRRLDPEGENHEVFKELMSYQESRIILDCHVDRIMKYMNIAKHLGMIDFYQHFILVSLDASVHADKLIQFQSNTTWLSPTEYDKLSDAQHFLASRVGAWKPNGGSPPVSSFQLEALLMVDMANHVIESVRAVEQQKELTKLPDPRYHVCDPELTPWEYGATLQNEMLKRQTSGVTGNIQFDGTGKRINYNLYVNEIHMLNRKTIGRWESANGDQIIVESNYTDSTSNDTANKHFIVISRKAKPYFYDKEPCVEENEEKCEDDGEKYEGFSVDLVKEIFKLLNDEWKHKYTYEFFFETDLKYGSYDPKTKKWTGLIGQLLDKKADLAVCDLTISEERKKVVDFSVPFMTLGISILYTQEHKVPPELFSFLNPYSFDVWMHTATAYCVVSIVLFICARISPADWENPQPCDKDPEELENIWNFKNCTWLTMGSIMTQGCDILPKAFGSRWVCSMWWFFAVIVCQTYIAQLSASMTSAMENEPINSVDDLANQNKILYGAIAGGSTLDFFKNSNDKIYRTMYKNMISNDGVLLVRSNDEGEKRVLDGHNKYAFFMESTTIDYKLKRNCELKKVGNLLDSKDYGIAMPANSPFRSEINRAILRLKELTILDKIKDKWWNEKYDAKPCEEPVDQNDVEGDLEMENLMGAFVVLIVGLVFCLFVTAAEFFDEVRNIVVREQVTHKEAFIKELKASLNFFQLQKPILRNPSRAASIASIKSQTEERQARRAQTLENFLDLEKITQ